MINWMYWISFQFRRHNILKWFRHELIHDKKFMKQCSQPSLMGNFTSKRDIPECRKFVTKHIFLELSKSVLGSAEKLGRIFTWSIFMICNTIKTLKHSKERNTLFLSCRSQHRNFNFFIQSQKIKCFPRKSIVKTRSVTQLYQKSHWNTTLIMYAAYYTIQFSSWIKDVSYKAVLALQTLAYVAVSCRGFLYFWFPLVYWGLITLSALHNTTGR
jgi:hypothetical protein